MKYLEPLITINGTILTEGQAMSLRVAAGAYILRLKSEGLGEDEVGRGITNGYLDRLREIETMMHDA